MRNVLLGLLLCTLVGGCASTETGEPPEPDRWDRVWTEAVLGTAAEKLAAGDPAAARLDLERAVERGMRDARVFVSLARVSVAEGRSAEALAALEYAEELDADVATTLELRGSLAELRGDWLAGAAAYAEVQARRPGASGPVIARVRCLRALGRSGEADAVVDAAIDGGTRSPGLLVEAGRVRLARGDCAAAQQRFDAALDIDPAHASARQGRGLVYHLLGNHEHALRALAPFAETGPVEVLAALGRSALIAGHYDTAVKSLRGALGATAADPDLWLDLGRALFLSERRMETLDALRHALTLRPEFPEALLLLGHLRLQSDQHAEAEAAYEMARRLTNGRGHAAVSDDEPGPMSSPHPQAEEPAPGIATR